MTESNENHRTKIGVIGGGIAGLTAALRLAQAGYDVALWERGPRFGGQAAAFPVDSGLLVRVSGDRLRCESAEDHFEEASDAHGHACLEPPRHSGESGDKPPLLNHSSGVMVCRARA